MISKKRAEQNVLAAAMRYYPVMSPKDALPQKLELIHACDVLAAHHKIAKAKAKKRRRGERPLPHDKEKQ